MASSEMYSCCSSKLAMRGSFAIGIHRRYEHNEHDRVGICQSGTFTDATADAVSDEVVMQWREQGYLLLKQAIPRSQAAAFLTAADRVISAYEADPPLRGARLLHHRAGHLAHGGSRRSDRPSGHVPYHSRADGAPTCS